MSNFTTIPNGRWELRFLCAGFVLVFALTGCATSSLMEDVSRLTVADLQVALGQASTDQDLAGMRCWTTLLEIVKERATKKPLTIVGAASTIQAKRHLANGSGVEMKKVNLGCAPLLVEETVWWAKLLTGLP